MVNQTNTTLLPSPPDWLAPDSVFLHTTLAAHAHEAHIQEALNSMATQESGLSPDVVYKSVYRKAKEMFNVKNAVEKGVIYPYANFSRGAKLLAAEMGMARLTQQNSPLFMTASWPKPVVLINWGAFNVPVDLIGGPDRKMVYINNNGVSQSADKLKFFNSVKGVVRIPEHTIDFKLAMNWIQSGETVFGRKKRGSGGRDIVLYDDEPDEFASSEFFSLYKKKKDEFRVHIVDGQVILVQRKAVRDTYEDGSPVDKREINYQIRNHANGFIFKRHDVQAPDDVIQQAKQAVAVMGLDFGAVDVIWNSSEQKGYVLEINTAPGLEGTTVKDYAVALSALVKKKLDNLS